MHASVLVWFAKGALGQTEVAGKRVLEVGSYDVNGTVRPLVERACPALYVGVDQTPGPGVDEVVPAELLEHRFGTDSFDIVIATELLEHAKDWRACLLGMAAVLRPGGLLLLTTRSPGFPYHPYPEDHWRYPVGLMRRILIAAGFGSHEITPDPDPASPGVFARARKNDPWRPYRPVLDQIEPEPVPCG